MEASPSQHHLATDIRAQHGALRGHAARLDALIEAAPTDRERRSWLAYLCLELNDFSNALALHFEDEETDPAFHDLVEQRPDLRSQVERLGLQHRSMLVDLDALRAGLGRYTTHELTTALSALLQRLDAHERAETELLQLAINRDLGGNG
jgi:hypothetical protein